MWRVKGSTPKVEKTQYFVHISNVKKNNGLYSKSFVKPDISYSDNQINIRWSQKRFCCSYSGTDNFVNNSNVHKWYGSYGIPFNHANKSRPKVNWVPKYSYLFCICDF